MPRYRKNPDLDFVVIPEVGRVAPGQILEGPEFERFALLGLLEALPELPLPPVAEPSRNGKQARAKPLPPPPVEEEAPEIQVDAASEDAELNEPPGPEEEIEATDEEEQARMAKRAAARQKGQKK